VITFWTENYLTVAIHEELFFRAIMMTGIARLFSRCDGLHPVHVERDQSVEVILKPKSRVHIDRVGWLIGLEVSSVMFGLMHLPRRSGEPLQQVR